MLKVAERLYVKRLTKCAVLPSRGSVMAAGLDLYSSEEVTVPSKMRAVVKTGLSIAVPEGYYGRIAPRSGLSVNYGLDVGAGVIDSDYRGEVCVLLFNFGEQDYEVNMGKRIAQLIIEKIGIPEVVETDELDETIRGAGGFGSTGN